MITEDLISYIQAQRRKNISEDMIVSRLSDAGWYASDIAEALKKLTPSAPVPIDASLSRDTYIPINSVFQSFQRRGPDPYREPPITGRPKAMEEKPWTPPVEKASETPSREPVSPNSTPDRAVFSKSFSEANPNTKTSFELKPEPQIDSVVLAKPIPPSVPKETHLEIRSEELMPTLKPKTLPADPSIPVPLIAPAVTLSATIPFVPKTESRFSSIANSRITPSVPKPTNKNVDSLPKGALLHSYQQALSSASRMNKELFQKKRNTFLRWLVVVLIISIIGGIAFAVSGDYIKIPFLKFSLIKRDPKTLLLNTPMVLEGLRSYKIETTAKLSVPSFADITSGLVSGEAVSSHDQDSISLYAKGIVSNGVSAPTFDYLATVTSSLLENSLVTDIKYDNGISFVTTPDLGKILGANAPAATIVSVPKGQFNSLTALFPDDIANKIKNIDVDKVLSTAVPSYVNGETASVLKDFVMGSSVIEKASEDVHGVSTYHYELSASRASTKKLLSQFAKIFLVDLSPDEQTTLDQAIGAVTIDSFEIWIGKNDNTIHKYKFNLTAPLSKIIGLDDKGIAGNTVTLSWQTSYWDFDVPNIIILPTDTTPINEFLKKIHDMKIKNSISSFKQAAGILHNALGKYGTRSNPTGSCTNPNPSSLFSPVGHAKGANAAVGTIAKIMTDLLNTTGGALSCYSMPDAWALSAPLATDPLSSYCADSSGTSTILKSSLNGTQCK